MISPSDEQEGWQSASRSYYVERYAAGSDRWTEISTVGPIAEELVARVRSLASAKPRLSLLDAGCGRLGMSLLLRKLIPNLGSVVAVDFAYEAIVEATPGLTDQAARAGIEFGGADFLRYDPGRQFDAVLDLGLFHHLVPGDWPRYRDRISRVLETDGTLLIRTFHPDDGNWTHRGPGGHVRRGYYCHYHTLDSLRTVLDDLLPESIPLARADHYEHVECLYQFRRRPPLPG